MADKAHRSAAREVRNLAWQAISLGARRPVDRHP